MPIYIFQHPTTEEVIEVVQSMNDVHEYTKDGVKWNRIFTKPQAAIDTTINPNSSRDFIEKTKQKNYSIGDLWDKSAELSEQRRKGSGHDDVKQKSINDYEKKTKKLHPSKTKGGIVEI